MNISVVSKFATTEYRYNHLKKFITSLTIVSFSSGLDSAIIKVIATRALLDIICLPSMIKCLFLLRNSRNKEAPILLQPSAKGWSLIMKYKRLAAFSSILGYSSCPKTF